MCRFRATIIDENQKKKVALDYDTRLVYKISLEFRYLHSSSGTLTKVELNRLISKITKEANKTGCSRAIVHEEGRLLVGILGQYRYWTLSRARLCALDILRHHLDEFPVGKS